MAWAFLTKWPRLLCVLPPSWHAGPPRTPALSWAVGKGWLTELSPLGQALSPLEETAHLVRTLHREVTDVVPPSFNRQGNRQEGLRRGPVDVCFRWSLEDEQTHQVDLAGPAYPGKGSQAQREQHRQTVSGTEHGHGEDRFLKAGRGQAWLCPGAGASPGPTPGETPPCSPLPSAGPVPGRQVCEGLRSPRQGGKAVVTQRPASWLKAQGWAAGETGAGRLSPSGRPRLKVVLEVEKEASEVWPL